MDYCSESEVARSNLAVLDDRELALVTGGVSATASQSESAWYQIGYQVANAYYWARERVSRFYEWLLT
jgi:hypothetical protein